MCGRMLNDGIENCNERRVEYLIIHAMIGNYEK
jgi:hypothetical protein